MDCEQLISKKLPKDTMVEVGERLIPNTQTTLRNSMPNTKINNWMNLPNVFVANSAEQVTPCSLREQKKIWQFLLLVFALISLFTCHPAIAAGFDCKNAKSSVEKLICADEQLSELDEALNRQFREALKKTGDRKSFVKEQQAWIRERNKCVDAECLQKAYKNRQMSLKSSSTCPFQERDLLGHWTAKNAQDFEEMLFEMRDSERIFLSWRHHRPELPGVWTFQECQIHIRHVDDPKLFFEYTILKLTSRALHLRELNGKETSTYVKTK